MGLMMYTYPDVHHQAQVSIDSQLPTEPSFGSRNGSQDTNGSSYDSYSVMSGGDLRVNSRDYVDLPNYAKIQDGSRTPITLKNRGAAWIRSSNILKDKRLFGAEYHKTVYQNVQQWKWYN